MSRKERLPCLLLALIQNILFNFFCLRCVNYSAFLCVFSKWSVHIFQVSFVKMLLRVRAIEWRWLDLFFWTSLCVNCAKPACCEAAQGVSSGVSSAPAGDCLVKLQWAQSTSVNFLLKGSAISRSLPTSITEKAHWPTGCWKVKNWRVPAHMSFATHAIDLAHQAKQAASVCADCWIQY